MNQIKQNFAFISYSHHDVKWAKWLRRKLEWYRLPSEIHNEFEDSRYIRPVFRDRDELTSGVLNNELRHHLDNSKYLIVLCSPHSASSKWVSDEVQTFIDMGRLEYIIPFIIGGDETCFPESLKIWNNQHPNQNLLGISVYDDGRNNRQKAFIRLVSYLIGVDFNILWQRHKREIRTIVFILSMISVFVLALAYWFMIPINLSITLNDEKSMLPGMEHGTLMINGEEYSLAHPDTTIQVSSLPGYYRLKPVMAIFQADRYYVEEHIPLLMTTGVTQHETILLHRDSTFAVFAGCVKDENGIQLCDVEVCVDSFRTFTNDNGHFSFTFPVSEQSETKSVRLQKQGYALYVRTDECPSENLQYILHKE